MVAPDDDPLASGEAETDPTVTTCEHNEQTDEADAGYMQAALVVAGV